MRIGIFGGTFNPPHLGHLVVAEHAREQLGLGRVVFVPTAISPHKLSLDTLEAHHRVEMLEAATSGNPAFSVSDVEIRRGGVSFTVDTLQELRQMFPAATLVLLIGVDNLADFHQWRDPAGILNLAEVVALTRPGFSTDGVDPELRRRITVCQVPAIGIEARQIRRRVREGKSIRYLVPSGVEAYIFSHHLYR